MGVLEGFTVQVGQEGLGETSEMAPEVDHGFQCCCATVSPFLQLYMLLALMFISLSQTVLCVPAIV